MKKYWPFIVLLLAALCAVAPFSSRRPDAVQRLVGMAGGTENIGKAFAGVAVAAAAAVVVGWGVRFFR